ncbi:MAG: hypothetical protein M0C28_24410 [Candidatus Moduliflexus flocculans]|nr:hypothetical protein [Candidatus Moduliflexus flocculans]
MTKAGSLHRDHTGEGHIGPQGGELYPRRPVSDRRGGALRLCGDADPDVIGRGRPARGGRHLSRSGRRSAPSPPAAPPSSGRPARDGAGPGGPRRDSAPKGANVQVVRDQTGAPRRRHVCPPLFAFSAPLQYGE